MRKRISYNWTKDSIYTLKWILISTTIFVLIMNFFVIAQQNMLSEILAISILITLIIGSRPILGLFTIPDTLYLVNNKIELETGELIEPKVIKAVWVKSTGTGPREVSYYEIELTELKTAVLIKNRKTLIAVEPYDIKYPLRKNRNFIKILKGLGLEEDKIFYSKQSWNSILGFRDKFKK